MNYYGSNNDWLNYLQHGQQGKERKNHKYYARVATGTDKQGNTQYRYFYTKNEYNAYSRVGKSRLTGAYRQEHHEVSGRSPWVATEEYVDRDGQTKLRKKYISADEYKRLRDARYRKLKAEKETDSEKNDRMKAAKKRYKKKTSAARRKRAVQKGAQTVARLFGRQLTFRQDSTDKSTEKKVKKAGWSKLAGSVYLRKKPKK